LGVVSFYIQFIPPNRGSEKIQRHTHRYTTHTYKYTNIYVGLHTQIIHTYTHTYIRAFTWRHLSSGSRENAPGKRSRSFDSALNAMSCCGY